MRKKLANKDLLKEYILAAVLLSGILLLSFLKVLQSDGVIGHTWDWGVPLYPEQYWNIFYNNLYIWRAEYETGRYFYFSLEFYYWLILLPFAFIGGENLSKLIPISLLFFSGLSMFMVAKRHARLNFNYAVLAGILYMLSPYAYSRLIAGHLPILFGYAILPCYVNFLLNILSSKSSEVKLND